MPHWAAWRRCLWATAGARLQGAQTALPGRAAAPDGPVLAAASVSACPPAAREDKDDEKDDEKDDDED